MVALKPFHPKCTPFPTKSCPFSANIYPLPPGRHPFFQPKRCPLFLASSLMMSGNAGVLTSAVCRAHEHAVTLVSFFCYKPALLALPFVVSRR